MNIFYSKYINSNTIVLQDEEFRHAFKSLRKKNGENLWVTDGLGNLYNCKITKINKSDCELQIVNAEHFPEYHPGLCMAVAPTKNIGRYEWFIEKAVEIGISRIVPILTSNSERRRLRVDRLHKIALSAMKQSKRLYLPEIVEPMQLKDYAKGEEAVNKFVAHYGESNPQLMGQIRANKTTAIMIGPEGDFTSEEILMLEEFGFIKVNLGKSRLRTETAALVACNIFNLAHQ